MIYNENPWRNFVRMTHDEKFGVLVILAVLMVGGVASAWIIPVRQVPQSDVNVLAEPAEQQASALHFEAAFDPNAVDSVWLVGHGFDPRQIYNLLNYRRKGGRYKTVEDFCRLYGFTPRDVAAVKPFVAIDTMVQQKYAPGSTQNKPHYTPLPNEAHYTIELNSADTAILNVLPGIGDKLAQRIVDYRSRLGGFCRIAQLAEVYGLSAETCQKIAPFVTVDDSKIVRLNINKASVSRLKYHPYCSFYLAKAIYEHRLKQPFTNAGELRLLNSTDTAGLSRFIPYICFE